MQVSVDFLISKGAYLNVQDTNGCTPLMLAAKGGYIKCVRALLGAGADTSIPDNDGVTALMHAEKRNNTICSRLIRGEMVGEREMYTMSRSENKQTRDMDRASQSVQCCSLM